MSYPQREEKKLNALTTDCVWCPTSLVRVQSCNPFEYDVSMKKSVYEQTTCTVVFL